MIDEERKLVFVADRLVIPSRLTSEPHPIERRHPGEPIFGKAECALQIKCAILYPNAPKCKIKSGIEESRNQGIKG
jgi:hypothetical protein